MARVAILTSHGHFHFTWPFSLCMDIITSHGHSHLKWAFSPSDSILTLHGHSHLTWTFVTSHGHSNLAWTFSPCVAISVILLPWVLARIAVYAATVGWRHNKWTTRSLWFTLVWDSSYVVVVCSVKRKSREPRTSGLPWLIKPLCRPCIGCYIISGQSIVSAA